MRIELCDLCGKKIPDHRSGYVLGRGFFHTSRLCDPCGKPLQPMIKKTEAAEKKVRGKRTR